MQDAKIRSALTLLLLLGALLFIYGPNAVGPLSEQPEADHEGFTYVADLDYWQRTERERVVKTSFPMDLAHDMNDIPLQIGDWHGRDVPETNLEVLILLEPEQFVRRLYQDPAGHRLWLTLIGSRQSRSFHPPDLCYIADGWHTTLSSQAISLNNGGEIYGLWLDAEKQFRKDAALTEHRVLYFYLFPDKEREQTDGIVLLKLTTPLYGTLEETIALQSEFLRHLFSQSQTSDNTL